MVQLTAETSNRLSQTDGKSVEMKTMVDSIKSQYDLINQDLMRNETMCYEIACKFEHQHEVIDAVVENIETLKSYALMNDLHIEAYQPL